MWRNPSSATSEMHNINMTTFDNGQPEEFIEILNNFRISIDGTGTTSVTWRINYLHMMLNWKSIIYFDELSSHNTDTINYHLKHIMEGLLGFLPPINSLSKQNCAMRCKIFKPQSISFNIFTILLTKINNYLRLFPRMSDDNNMDSSEQNKILLHNIPNNYAKKSYLHEL